MADWLIGEWLNLKWFLVEGSKVDGYCK